MSEIKIIGVISKLRPRVKQGRVVELDDLADQIAAQSGFDRGDARDFAYKFAQALVSHLKHAAYVKLGDIGSFRVGCDKDRQLKVLCFFKVDLVGIRKQVLHIPMQGALIALQRQDVVGPLVHNQLGDLGLTTHGVDGDDAALQRQHFQQGRQSGDLIRLGVHFHLSQGQAVG